MVNKAYLSLGSNIENKALYLARAVGALIADEKCEVIDCSSIYETSPYGKKDQENFLNSVIFISSDYSVQDLLKRIKEVEIEVGRTNFERWGPREIDIDILLYNDLVYADEKLSIPHIELTERDFFIEPLLEINPDAMHPAFNISLRELAIESAEKYIVKKLDIDLITKAEEYLG